ncbi:putative alpha-L-fucosidase [Helianthus debilis subsp. tardiflorus]
MELIYNLLLYVTLLLPPVSILSSPGCNFLAVFNFGDSNPDTGALVAMFGQAAARPPNGETFFSSPAGRVCNDRLLIVFKFRWVLEERKVNDLGGRTFWIHNTWPVGCLPYIMDTHMITAEQVDKYGCVTPSQGSHRFGDPFLVCCGYGGKYNFNNEVRCGKMKMANGTKMIIVKSCEDPSSRIVWDGVHFTRWLIDGCIVRLLTGVTLIHLFH